MSVIVKIQGLNELQRRLGKDLRPALRGASLVVGHQLRGKMQKYPGPSHKPVLWASERQRRWWFASRRKKGLPFKYSRLSDPWSQRLQGSWEVKRQGSIGAIVGTRADYAPRVQSKMQQTRQHKATGWVTDEQAVKDVVDSGEVDRIFQDAIRKAFR